MNQEEIIKQFEEWTKTNPNGNTLILDLFPSGVYCDDVTYGAWLGYQAALASKQEDIKQGLDDIQLSMSMFANKEDYLKAVKEQDHIESNQDAGLKAMLEYSRETGNAFIHQPKAIEPEIDGDGSGILCPPCSQSEKIGRIEPAQDNEGWIDWTGGKNNGERPLTQYVACEVKFRNGDIAKNKSNQFNWKNYGEEDDIIAYRTAKESQ